MKVDRTPFDVERARLRVAEFETQHGTDDPVVAFLDKEGRLVETDDFREWMFLYTVLGRIDGQERADP